ncbi:MAG TPA: GNAT family N-acetyltransferase [Chitinophagaceae bacterium]|nr:GNAT family N-acetyltransferase [Chitinophagaceae bacterium]
MSLAIDPSNQQTAALYTMFGVMMKCQNKKMLAAQSVDTMTDEAYRGKGLFISLANYLYAESKLKNIEFVYGFPNANSISGFIKKLNWKEIDEVPFIVKPMRTRYLASKFIKNNFLKNLIPDISLRRNKKINSDISIQRIQKFDENFDLLWNEYSKNIKISVDRNAPYLNWRLIEKPNEDYQNYGAYINGKLIGFISYCIKNKHEGRIGYVMEFFYDPANDTLAKELLSFALNDMASQKTDMVLAWSLKHSDNYSSFLKEGFFYLQKKFRPIQLFFGANDFGNNIDLHNSKNWYISYLDSDTV